MFRFRRMDSSERYSGASAEMSCVSCRLYRIWDRSRAFDDNCGVLAVVSDSVLRHGGGLSCGEAGEAFNPLRQSVIGGGKMNTQIFVNLPVKDLDKSISFFTELGYTFNQQFTDRTATCMIVSDTIYVMLLTRDKFKTFTPKEICDTTKSTEVLLCLSCESRAKVDEMVHKAVAAGGTTFTEAKDHGFMYQHGFQDPDGHIWELIYMEPSAKNQQI